MWWCIRSSGRDYYAFVSIHTFTCVVFFVPLTRLLIIFIFVGVMANKFAQKAVQALAHPRDRRTRQLEKYEKRADRLAGQKNKHKMIEDRLHVRFLWFREQCQALGYTHTRVPEDHVLPLVQLFIDRNDEEMQLLRSTRNAPRGQLRRLEAAREVDMDALRSSKGFTVPSLRRSEDVEILTSIWDGLAATMVVVPRASVSLGARQSVCAVTVAKLRQLLKPLEQVHADSEALLPCRTKRDLLARMQGKKKLCGRNDHTGPAAGSKKVCVKHVESDMRSVRTRDNVRRAQGQQQRLREARRSVLHQHRMEQL